MRSDYLEPSVFSIEVVPNMESHKGRVVSGEEVLRALLDLPVGIVGQFAEAVAGEELAAPVDHVEG